MSHVNSPVDEARAYFKKSNLSDDAPGKPIPKKEDKKDERKDTWTEKDKHGVEWETNTKETPDSEW